MAILYLHGFMSSGNTPKTAELKRRFPDELVITPDLSVYPLDALKQIESIINNLLNANEHEFVVVGTSLGGLYASLLNKKYGIPTVVINPAMNPVEILAKQVGTLTNFKTGETFEFTQDHLEEFNNVGVGFDTYPYHFTDSLHVVIAKDDDVIEVDRTISFFNQTKAKVHVFETGGHRFDDMAFVYSLIDQHISNLSNYIDPMGDVDI